MTGYFVTDDKQNRCLWKGNPDDPTPQLLAWRAEFTRHHGVSELMFDAAAAVLAPDDALIERVARALYVHGRQDLRAQARAVLAALREEAGASGCDPT